MKILNGDISNYKNFNCIDIDVVMGLVTFWAIGHHTGDLSFLSVTGINSRCPLQKLQYNAYLWDLVK